MDQLTEPRSEATATPRGDLDRAAGLSLVIGGLAFLIGGIAHPTDRGHGGKVRQLHDMLVATGWYPAHAMLLSAMALFAIAVVAVRRQDGLPPRADRLLGLVLAVGCVGLVSMTIHLLAPLGASSVADGKVSLLSRVQTVNEAIDAAWGVSLAAFAAVGGWTRTAGNRLTALVGVVGGLAFAVASAAIPYTDTFDAVFKVGSLLSVWAVAVGVLTLRRAGTP